MARKKNLMHEENKNWNAKKGPMSRGMKSVVGVVVTEGPNEAQKITVDVSIQEIAIIALVVKPFKMGESYKKHEIYA